VLAFEGPEFILAGGNLDPARQFDSDGDGVAGRNTTRGRNGTIVAACGVTPVDNTGDGVPDTQFGRTALSIDRLAISDRRAAGGFDVLFQAFGSGPLQFRQEPLCRDRRPDLRRRLRPAPGRSRSQARIRPAGHGPSGGPKPPVPRSGAGSGGDPSSCRAAAIIA
jgi:hypothetical protein